GFEADFQGSLERDHNTFAKDFTLEGIPTVHVNGAQVIDYSTKIEWFGTARLRAGYVWGNGDVFSYVTGGLAYGKVDLDGTSTASGTATGCIAAPGQPGCPLSFSATRAIGHSNVNTGWTLGYGTEGRLATPGWTWRVETYYMDLGHLNDNDVTRPDCPGPNGGCSLGPATGGQTITHTHFTDWILRGGLNY